MQTSCCAGTNQNTNYVHIKEHVHLNKLDNLLLQLGWMCFAHFVCIFYEPTATRTIFVSQNRGRKTCTEEPDVHRRTSAGDSLLFRTAPPRGQEEAQHGRTADRQAKGRAYLPHRSPRLNRHRTTDTVIMQFAVNLCLLDHFCLTVCMGNNINNNKGSLGNGMVKVTGHTAIPPD